MIAQEYHLHLLTNKKSFHVLSPVKSSSIVFQALLKASILGLPSVITALKGTRTKSDSEALIQDKKAMSEYECYI